MDLREVPVREKAMSVKTDRFWQLSATLDGRRPSCEMPLGKEDEIRAYGMCGVKATDLCSKSATECVWCSDNCDGHLLCRDCQIAVCDG
jgi:hypothetical protein